MPGLTNDNTSTIDQLEAVLANQQDITTAMAGMIEKQRALVEAGDAEGLLALLSHRQQLVDRLIASQDALGESLAAAERSLPGADRERKSRIEAALSAIQSQLADIMERDKLDQEWLERGRTQTRGELGKLDVMHKAHAAYGRDPKRANRFADHKG